jgi:hypothetical protein
VRIFDLVAVTRISLAFFAVCFGDVAIEEREATSPEHKPVSMEGIRCHESLLDDNL